VAQWVLEDDINARTIDGYRQTFDLYFKPALGHIRLCDLQPHHFRDFAAALRKINRPEADGDRSDLLRRLLDARAKRDGKRISTRALTDGRIRRVMAVASSALNDLVPEVLPVNPAGKVKVGKVRRQRPLVWTDARIERWKQTGAVPVDRRQLMVWTAQHTGAFLDSLHVEKGRVKPERLYAIFHLAVFSGMRRSELAGLEWADCDLETRRIHVRHAQVEKELDTTKSEDSERIIVIDAGTADVLKAWRKQQLAERLAWGPAWIDSGRVFTREDGTPLNSTWISQRFLTLAGRAGMPPVSLHSLRHGTATMQLAAGVPAKVVSENLGHATVAFTLDVYTSVLDQLLEDAAERTAALVPLKSKITAV
jgi:integrase